MAIGWGDHVTRRIEPRGNTQSSRSARGHGTVSRQMIFALLSLRSLAKPESVNLV